LTSIFLWYFRFSNASLDEANERWDAVVEAICGDARTKECLLEAEAGELLEAVDKVKRPFVGMLGPRNVSWRPRLENFWRL
jgi:hypothetical protein